MMHGQQNITEDQCWTDSSVSNTTISRTWRDIRVEGSNKNVYSCTMYSPFNSVSLMMGQSLTNHVAGNTPYSILFEAESFLRS